MILLKSDLKLIIGVAVPIFIWFIIVFVVFWKLLIKYPLGKWSTVDPNPNDGETLSMPRGTIRSILAITILILVVLLQIYAINNMPSMDKISTMINAFEIMLAFYFGGKVMHHLASVDKSKTKSVADAQQSDNNFNDPEAIG